MPSTILERGLRNLPATIDMLGSKRRLLGRIVPPILNAVSSGDRVLDAFCGTGSVSLGLSRAGIQVTACDQMQWCTTVTAAALMNREPPDAVLAEAGLHDYRSTLSELNSLAPREGFIWRNYSPASRSTCSVERRYFTEENAGRIDAIRHWISVAENVLPQATVFLLIRDLLQSAVEVSNVAGTYGAYLKHWKPNALRPLQLRPSAFMTKQNEIYEADVRTGNATLVAADFPWSAIYADPPYTKRQYAAYYHILETIAEGDEPAITGSTGLRPWKDKASDWCYSRRAPSALQDFLGSCNTSHLFLSYSEDGHLDDALIREMMSKEGFLRVYEFTLSRYRSNSGGNGSNLVTERLYHLDRR